MNRAMRSGGLLLVVLASVAGASCGGAEDTRPVKWSYISTAIVQPNCATANCHSTLSQRSGVQLDDIPTGYYQLVARHFVLPGRPDASALMALIRGQGSRRMPPDFALPKDDIDLIGRWIANGAPYDGTSPAPVIPPDIMTTTPNANSDAGTGN